MPVITDPGEPYFKNGLWGWDAAADLWLPLAVDPATNYLIVNARGTVEVYQTDPADMRVGAHGWDGGDWRRLPILWGFSETWAIDESMAMPANGTYSQDTVAIPAGYVYKLEWAMVLNSSAARGYAYIAIRNPTGIFMLVYDPTPAVNIPTSWNGSLTLNPGDYIIIRMGGCIALDNLRSVVRGYKMLIAE